jgi:hypothetical protein
MAPTVTLPVEETGAGALTAAGAFGAAGVLSVAGALLGTGAGTGADAGAETVGVVARPLPMPIGSSLAATALCVSDGSCAVLRNC